MARSGLGASSIPIPHALHINGTHADNGSQAVSAVVLGDLNLGLHENNHKDSETKASACRDALFLTDPRIDREWLINTKGARVAGTCEWITRNPIYQSWLAGNTGLLWISGSPGRGKTILSIFLTEELERLVQASAESQVLFYFCSHQDEKRNTALAILRGLIHQIITHRPKLAGQVLPYFEGENRARHTLGSFEPLWLIFCGLIRKLEDGPLFCVVDGLDECDKESRRTFVSSIVDLFSSQGTEAPNTKLKLIIVSRDIPGLEDCMRIRLDPDNNVSVTDDIKVFTTVRIKELSRLEGFDESLREYVYDTLMQRSKGTFLWIGFVMTELLKKRTCSEVLEALKDLPKGLPELYTHMLLQIEGEHRRSSSAILRWVTMAFRPLQLEELAVAVGTQSSHLISTEQAIRDQVALCGPLLQVQDRRVVLVHQSVRDFLLGEDLASNIELYEFSIKPGEADLTIAQVCLETILRSGLQHHPIDLRDPKCLENSPLLKYAALNWAVHANRCAGLAARLLESSPSFFKSGSVVRKHWWLSRMEGAPPPPLHMGSYLGILPWVEEVSHVKDSWNPFTSINEKDGSGLTAVCYAAAGGQAAVLEHLISRGANIHLRDEARVSALSYAITSNEEKAVRVLLDHGAADNELNYTWALAVTCARGNEGVFKLLYPYGEQFGSRIYSPSIFHAVCLAHMGIVDFLLSQGVTLDVEKNQSALTIAASDGRTEAVLWLLAHGATVDGCGPRGPTALCRAAKFGHKALVQLLLDKGASVDARNSHNGRTPLHGAALKGQEEIVHLLLDHNAEINAQDNSGGSALHQASSAGSALVVELLLNRGADPNLTNNDGHTALDYAATTGNDVVMQLLLKHGAVARSPGGVRSETPAAQPLPQGHNWLMGLLNSQVLRPFER